MMKSNLFLFFFCFFVAAGFPLRLHAELMDKIIAVVNSDIITEKELDVFMKVAGMESDQVPEGDPNEVRGIYLDRLVEDKLILQQALKLGFKANDAAIEDRIKEMKMRAGSPRVFDQALRSQALSLNDMRQKLREQFVVYELIRQQVKEKVQVSPKEIAEYFEEHRGEYLTSETAVVDSIFVPDKESVAEVQSALAGGKDFSEAAATFSKRSNIVLVPRGQFKKDLEDFIFGLAPGKPSEPFAVDDGFYIFLLKEIKPPSSQSLSEVKNTIKKKLEAQKTHQAMREFIESLKDKAYISLRDI
jgi:parvulin-like peptidyl-prolyl isomerase